MKKGLIIYTSKYGATKKYVDLLKEEFACDVYDLGGGREPDPEEYDWIVFAGGIYASGISGLRALQKKYKNVNHKKMILFCVGASPFDEKAFEEIKAHNLKEDWKDIPVFYGRGAWDESKMNWKDRALCKMLQKAVAQKDPSSCEPWMKALLGAAGQSCDWTDANYLTPLLNYIKTEHQP